MKSITYTNARKNLAATLADVCRDPSTTIRTRSRNATVLMISLDDYEALEETSYLLRSPENARRLLESIEQLNAGKGVEREI